MATAHQHVHRLPDKELKVLYPAWGNMFLRIKTLHSQVVKTQWPKLINMFIELHDKELKSLVSYLGERVSFFGTLHIIILVAGTWPYRKHHREAHWVEQGSFSLCRTAHGSLLLPDLRWTRHEPFRPALRPSIQPQSPRLTGFEQALVYDTISENCTQGKTFLHTWLEVILYKKSLQHLAGILFWLRRRLLRPMLYNGRCCPSHIPKAQKVLRPLLVRMSARLLSTSWHGCCMQGLVGFVPEHQGQAQAQLFASSSRSAHLCKTCSGWPLFLLEFVQECLQHQPMALGFVKPELFLLLAKLLQFPHRCTWGLLTYLQQRFCHILPVGWTKANSIQNLFGWKMNSVVSDSPCSSCAITKPCPLPSAFCLAAIFHFCTLPNVANWPLVFYDLLTTDKAHKQLPLRPPPQWQEPWCSKVLSPQLCCCLGGAHHTHDKLHNDP